MYSYILLFPHILMYIYSIYKNSYYVFLINSVFLVLVTGQAFYMEIQIYNYGTSNILHEYPTNLESFKIALFLYFIILLEIAIFPMLFTKFQKKTVICKNQNIFYKKVYINYKLLSIIIIITTLYYLHVIGGINNLLYKVRPSMVSGATLPLSVLLGIAVVFCYKIYYKNKLIFFDYFLIFYIITIFSLSGSRILIVYFTMTIFLSYVISYKKKLNYKFILLFVIAAFFTLIISQAIKEYYSNSTFTFSETVFLVISSFYQVATEAFAGFSGYISYALENGFSTDFGLQFINGLIQFIPSQIRHYFKDIQSFINDLYPYKYSIVTPGLQNFLIHFSFLFLLIYPSIFIILILVEQKIKYKRINFIKFYSIISIMVQSTTLIRGSTVFFVYFLGVQIIFGLLFYFLLLKRFVIKNINQ